MIDQCTLIFLCSRCKRRDGGLHEGDRPNDYVIAARRKQSSRERSHVVALLAAGEGKERSRWFIKAGEGEGPSLLC